MIGNSVAVLVLSKWERMFDKQKFDAHMNRRLTTPVESPPVQASEPRV